MKTLYLLVATTSITAIALLGQGPSGTASSYAVANGTVLVPDSSKENPSDVGRRMHTNHLIFLRGQAKQSYVSGLTPADIQRAYQLTGLGGKGTIAIVDAYHYPNAAADLATFSSGSSSLGFAPLPPCNASGSAPCFQQVYAGAAGTETVNCGWNQEAALDIEWAHAMAPNASIVLVEARSNSTADLFDAVQRATDIVKTNGGGVVSMSWGGSEYAGETSLDQYFSSGADNTNVVYIASSGDTGGKTIYPSTSPNVIAAGGTTLNMTGSRGTAQFSSETGWSGSGGGTSPYEPRGAYQTAAGVPAGSNRVVPDFSFDADPNTGVLVYGPTCSGTNASGWMIFGGTSVSAPALAGIINSAANGSARSTADELARIYALPNGTYRDITSGRAGKYAAASGWDFVTGIGVPVTLTAK